MSGFRFSAHDHMAEAARMTGVPGWQGYRWELVEGGSIVTGCVPSGVYTRGPRKGEPKYRPATPGTERRVVIANTHMDTVAAAYEAEHGTCWDCKGTGETWAGWSAKEGSKYRTCSRCDGTGKAGATT